MPLPPKWSWHVTAANSHTADVLQTVLLASIKLQQSQCQTTAMFHSVHYGTEITVFVNPRLSCSDFTVKNLGPTAILDLTES